LKPFTIAGCTALLALASCNAAAQSSVTLYGLIEDGIDYINNSGGHSLYAMRDGAFTGLYGSRWGLLMQEDLGGSLKAVARLENGFNITNGKLGQGGLEFGRQAYVGLSDGNLGTVTLGRQYDSVIDYLQFASTNAQWGGIATHASDIDNLGNSYRVNNAVKYTSQDLGPFKFGGLYGFSNSSGPGSVGTTAVWSAGANFTYRDLKLGAAYFFAKQPAQQFVDGHYMANTTGADIGASGPWSYVGNPKNVQTIGAGGTYLIGKTTLGALFTRVKFEDANGTTGDVRFDDYDVSVSYAATPALRLGIAYLYTVGHIDYAAQTAKYHRIALGSYYSLSKRTSVYGVVVAQQSAGDAKGAVLYQGTGGSISTTNRQIGVRAAIIHRF
jgi:predicted porin